MSERDEGADDAQRPWLLTQETPGLDPERIRQEAGPDWAPGTPDDAQGSETIDEADVESGPPGGEGAGGG